MKKNFNFITIFLLLAFSVLLFSGCDSFFGWLFEDTNETEGNNNNNGNNNSGNNNNGSNNPAGSVEPLTTSKWSQGSPYNDLFPMVNGSRSVTDCGNLALAQIIRFHQYPVSGTGQSTSVRINSDTLTVPTVNFNVKYDWNNMLDSYTTANPGSAQQRNAAATLVYHVSAAVGDNTATGHTHPRNYAAALTGIFGYDKSIQIHYRMYYNDNDWEAMIRQQLDLGLPVYYWGRRDNGTHAFVVEGYDNTGKFHINWGWSGRDNGWFTLNNLNPPSTGHYYFGHLIITNI